MIALDLELSMTMRARYDPADEGKADLFYALHFHLQVHWRLQGSQKLGGDISFHDPASSPRITGTGPTGVSLLRSIHMKRKGCGSSPTFA